MILTSFLSYASAFVANYQPLGQGNYFRTISDDCFRIVGEFQAFHGEPFRVWRLTCSKVGDRVAWSGPIYNDGSFAVRVTGFPLVGEDAWPLRNISAWYAEVKRLGPIPPDDQLKPFRPFTVKPGQGYWIQFRAELAQSCSQDLDGRDYSAGRRSAMEMAYKVGPFSRHDWLLSLPQLEWRCPTVGNPP